MVEVFKTNVASRDGAAIVLHQIHKTFPACRANFDLQDCDRILRVENPTGSIDAAAVVALVRENGFWAEPLPDEAPPAKSFIGADYLVA
jgi:hypothetical protein